MFAIPVLMLCLFPGPHPLHFPESPLLLDTRLFMFPCSKHAMLDELLFYTLGHLSSFSLGYMIEGAIAGSKGMHTLIAPSYQ